MILARASNELASVSISTARVFMLVNGSMRNVHHVTSYVMGMASQISLHWHGVPLSLTKIWGRMVASDSTDGVRFHVHAVYSAMLHKTITKSSNADSPQIHEIYIYPCRVFFMHVLSCCSCMLYSPTMTFFSPLCLQVTRSNSKNAKDVCKTVPVCGLCVF